MLQPRCDLDLAAEAVDVHAGNQLGREQLDHDAATERCLFGHEHARHATAAELTLDGVRGAERGLELLLK